MVRRRGREGGREGRREEERRKRESGGRERLIISYKVLSLDCTCTYRLIVTIKSCEGRGRVGRRRREEDLFFVI